jgi:hypothetical protein
MYFLLTCDVNVQFEGSNDDNDDDNNELDENEVSDIEETEMDDSIQRINYQKKSVSFE